jgi:ADP-heptose:LPS heptosyltransferase
MFFTRVIKNNHHFSKAAGFIINSFLFFIRLFVVKRKKSNIIVIIALHRLGDSVFTLPAISNIIEFHKTNIYLICFTEIKSIYSLVFNSINFVEINHQDFFYNYRIAKSRTRRILKKLQAQTIYDMTGDVSSASLIFTDRASQIIGINEPYYRNLYTKFKCIRNRPHLVDNYLDGIRDIIPIKKFIPEVRKQSNKNFQIIIHPFASSKSKQWGLWKFIELARVLRQQYECTFVSLPGAIPNDVKEEILKHDIIIIETKSTAELIEVIKNGSLLIGNDSGAIQIADLLGIPTFTLYGPTNPEYHTPKYCNNQFVVRQLSCSPKTDDKWCFTHGGVFCPSNECMIGLSFNEVKNDVLSMINNLKRNNGST